MGEGPGRGYSGEEAGEEDLGVRQGPGVLGLVRPRKATCWDPLSPWPWTQQWNGASHCDILQVQGHRGGAAGWWQGSEGQDWRSEQSQCFVEHLLYAALYLQTLAAMLTTIR